MKIKDDYIYLPTGEGHFISEKQRRISEILKDYDPYLELQWIPVEDRDPNDKYSFRVVDTSPGHPPFIVTFAHECDERLLAKIIQIDNKHGNVLNFLDAHNAAVELYEKKKLKEQRMEAHQLAYDILRSPKYHYRHGGIDFGSFNDRR